MKKVIAIAAGSVAVIALAASVFWYCHPTHYSFNDRYVIGTSMQKIIDRYGEPHSTTENTVTYMIHDDTPELIMGKDNSVWYVIEFENGIAVNVYLREGYIGG